MSFRDETNSLFSRERYGDWRLYQVSRWPTDHSRAVSDFSLTVWGSRPKLAR